MVMDNLIAYLYRRILVNSCTLKRVVDRDRAYDLESDAFSRKPRFTFLDGGITCESGWLKLGCGASWNG